jgi:hypothetical protein
MFAMYIIYMPIVILHSVLHVTGFDYDQSHQFSTCGIKKFLIWNISDFKFSDQGCLNCVSIYMHIIKVALMLSLCLFNRE